MLLFLVEIERNGIKIDLEVLDLIKQEYLEEFNQDLNNYDIRRDN